MVKYLIFFLFVTPILPKDGLPYISPGVQVGIDSKGHLFTSTQITLGYVGPVPPIGLTFGSRWYSTKGKKKRYSYTDFQIWPAFFGIGVGQIIDEKGNKSHRLKTGVGAWGYLTFDTALNFNNYKYNFGLIGVFPVPIGEMPSP